MKAGKLKFSKPNKYWIENSGSGTYVVWTIQILALWLTVSQMDVFISRKPSLDGRTRKLPLSMRAQAAKLPAGVEMPKVEPKLTAHFLGFTTTAKTWNSRACMIGLIGTFIVVLIFHKGILQIIGVDVGKGLDIPL